MGDLVRLVDRAGQGVPFLSTVEEDIIGHAMAGLAVAYLDLHGVIIPQNAQQRLNPLFFKLRLIQPLGLKAGSQRLNLLQRLLARIEQAFVPLRQSRDDFVQVVIRKQAVVAVADGQRLLFVFWHQRFL